MSHTRIELCMDIPGPKTKDQPLDQAEIYALSMLSPLVLEALQAKEIERIIDYVGNYFLVFPDQSKEEKMGNETKSRLSLVDGSVEEVGQKKELPTPKKLVPIYEEKKVLVLTLQGLEEVTRNYIVGFKESDE